MDGEDRTKAEEKPESVRANAIWLLMGTNRTGKSVTARKIVENWIESRPTDQVVGFDPQGVFTGLLDYELKLRDSYGNGDWSEFINENDFRDCLVILDEFRMLNPKRTASKGLIELMSMRAARNLDIIIIIHSPNLIIDILGGFVNHYLIFNTYTTIKKLQDVIPNWETIATGINRINEYCLVNGIYTARFNEGKVFYPKFPYIYYDVKAHRLHKVNFLTMAELSEIQEK